MPAMDYSQIAHLYDAYASTTFDVPFFLEEIRGCSSALELMAGTGRLSLPLIEAGVPLTCVDSSPDMLDLLRQKLSKRNVEADVIQADVAALSLGRTFDRILLPFHSFAELLTEAEQLATLQGVRAHLAEGGRFICPLHNPPVRARTLDGALRLGGRFPLQSSTGADVGATLALWSAATFDSRTGMAKGMQVYEIYTRDGEMRSRRSVDLQFVLLSPETFESLAARAGLRVESVYGDYSSKAPFDPATSPVMIYILNAASLPSRGAK